MCFDGDGEHGALRLGIPEFSDPLQSIGQHHWGLDFEGISIITESNGQTQKKDVNFCKTPEANAATACGAIPDSGTTLIMGPKLQLIELYEEICDAWGRCADAFRA